MARPRPAGRSRASSLETGTLLRPPTPPLAPDGGARSGLTRTLAARQVHELQLGVHLLSHSLGPGGPGRGSAARRPPLEPWSK